MKIMGIIAETLCCAAFGFIMVLLMFGTAISGSIDESIIAFLR